MPAKNSHQAEGEGRPQRPEDSTQPDLFVAAMTGDWPVKDDISSMEYPIFALAKQRSTAIRTCSRGGRTIKVVPSAYGAATVFDKDILIYCISQIVAAVNNGRADSVSRRVHIDVHQFLVGTRRSTGGAAYARVVDMCRRLKGTTIETNVRTTAEERTQGFGLIEDYDIVQHTKNGSGALELEMTISNWMYRAALDFDILTLNPAYFDLGQAMERRLYEIVRKHCGDKAWWVCGLPILHEKTGSASIPKKFKQEIKSIIQDDQLPDYRVILDETVTPNQVVFMTRDNKKLMAEANKEGKVDWVAYYLQSKLPGSK